MFANSSHSGTASALAPSNAAGGGGSWRPWLMHGVLLLAMLSAMPATRASLPFVESNTPGASPSAPDPQPNFVAIPGINAGWASGVVRWYYNPAGEPATLRGQVEGLIDAANAEWSSHCDVHFVYQGLSTAVPRMFDGQTVIGWNASQSYSGITFPQTSAGRVVEAGIEMNPNMTNDPEFASQVLVHEIGHLLGLAHSDVQGAVMSGPPSSSYSYATHLSEDDIAGCQALYDNLGCTSPQPPPVISTVGCVAPTVGTRTLRQTSVCSNHAWGLNPPTIVSNACVASTASPPPPIVPAAAPARPSPTLVVKEYHRAARDDYFLTASPTEQSLLESRTIDGWIATGHSFAAWDSPVTGTVAVCRFFGDWRIDAAGNRLGPDTHFYTSDASECAYVPVHWPVWVLETTAAFYVLPGTNAGCAAGTLPIQRLFHPAELPTHRYVADASVAAQFAQQGWTPEGVAFCAPAS